MASEARITINRQPDTPGAAPMGQAAAGQKANRDDILRRRKQIHEQARADLSPSSVPADEPPMAPPPHRENVETIEFTAPNGMTIEYGPRSDISTIDRVSRIYAGRDTSRSEYLLTRILLGIRTINGVPPTTIVDEVTRTKMANQVGDEVIDLLIYYDHEHWPPLLTTELPLVKKKLRT
jgi:hypothetical protein